MTVVLDENIFLFFAIIIPIIVIFLQLIYEHKQDKKIEEMRKIIKDKELSLDIN